MTPLIIRIALFLPLSLLYSPIYYFILCCGQIIKCDNNKKQVFCLSPAGIHIVFVLVIVVYLFSHTQSKILITTPLFFCCCFAIFDMIVASICILLLLLLFHLSRSRFILSFQLSVECVFRFSSSF